MVELSRRGFLIELGIAAVAAPAIIRSPGILMPVKNRLIQRRKWGVWCYTARDVTNEWKFDTWSRALTERRDFHFEDGSYAGTMIIDPIPGSVGLAC